ncbi:MAG: metal-dependent transcriptional regulator [Spirochaetales bacterium]|nr:metal-dependent transcriptional regulator [Spirochaetales bacterium]
MSDFKSLSHSLEDYLEAILILERKNRVARVRDIATHLDVQMPSVTGAVKNLKEKGLVDYEKNSFICLTETGMKAAEEVLNRHSALMEFLEKVLLIPHSKAEYQACEMEHSIDSETASRIKKCTEAIVGSFGQNGFMSLDDWEKNLNKKS